MQPPDLSGSESHDSCRDQPLEHRVTSSVEHFEPRRGRTATADVTMNPRQIRGLVGSGIRRAVDDGENRLGSRRIASRLQQQEILAVARQEIITDALGGESGPLQDRPFDLVGADYGVQPRDQSGPARRHLERREIAQPVENTVRQLLLGSEDTQHSLLDGLLGNQVDHAHGTALMLAPGTRDTLLQLGRVPRKIAVDHDARHLQVQAEATRIAGEKEAAERILLDATYLHTAPLLGHRAMMPGNVQVHLPR